MGSNPWSCNFGYKLDHMLFKWDIQLGTQFVHRRQTWEARNDEWSG